MSSLNRVGNYNSRILRIYASFAIILALSLSVTITIVEAKDFKKEYPKGTPCLARLEGTTTHEPLLYTCPRPNESEKKSYCCYIDKCCDAKEYQRAAEQQYKAQQGLNYGYIAKGAIGKTLKVLLGIILTIILIIVGCCCLTFFLCRKKKLFQGGIFSSPLPPQPPGPSPYAPPANPYMAYQWPPETAPPPPPAYPTPAYPPYPSSAGSGGQPPYNPNFK